MQLAKSIVLAASLGSLIAAHALESPAGSPISDAGLARIHGLSPANAPTTKDICSGQSLLTGQITAADCVITPQPQAPCVSCGTGQLQGERFTSGNIRPSAHQLPCNAFQRNVGICWWVTGGIYHCMNMTPDPMIPYCTQGTYSAIIYQGF